MNTKSIEEALSIFTEVSILIITRYAISFVNLKGEGEREREVRCLKCGETPTVFQARTIELSSK